MIAGHRALLDALHEMGAAGLSPGASGNISVRVDDGMIISASGAVAGKATDNDIVFVAEQTTSLVDWPDDQPRPSSEWQMHQALYRSHPHINAVVHCHSTHATALACMRRPIPAFHYMVSVAGGDDIPCCDYALFGSEALSTAVCQTLAHRHACLMANHGQICIADDATRALALAKEVEALAASYLLCLQSGEPVLLSDQQMAEVTNAFSHYGQRLK